MSAKKQTVAKWKIAKLKDHPRQAEMFGDVDEAELKALAESLQKHGLRDPVHVTPDGTVIRGHQRVRAAKRLGWAEIDVVVRHDLAGRGEAAVEVEFVADNFERRHLSPLARAKSIRRLMELEEGRAAGDFRWTTRDELKARIASRMGLSPRSVARYLLILDAPTPVQRLLDAGELTLVAAGKVALLPKTAQAEVVRRVGAGEKPAKVVAEATRGDADPAAPARSFVRLLGALAREIPRLRGMASAIRPGRLRSSEAIVRDAVEVLAEFAAAAPKAS